MLKQELDWIKQKEEALKQEIEKLTAESESQRQVLEFLRQKQHTKLLFNSLRMGRRLQ